MLKKTGRWSVVADVSTKTAKGQAEKKRLENLFALDGAIRTKRGREAKNTAANAFAEAEKDFRFGTGVFAPKDEDME